ncbi:MAG TPA: PadR family transcriptional regulator [Solirubrobacter sp.]|nr:PadR family transcriptional regulator [Solirubrobacter sp.]
METADHRRDWLRGVLDLCLLALLADGEAYGYELARRLETLGFGPVPGGSLYPALLRRERLGHLRAEWRAGAGGPGRKYYVLTDAGRAALESEARGWHAFADTVAAALAGRGAAARGEAAT